MDKSNHQLPRRGHSSDSVLKTVGCGSRYLHAEEAWRAGGRRWPDEETEEAWNRHREILATAEQNPWESWPSSRESLESPGEKVTP